MSLQTRLAALITAIGADIKTLQNKALQLTETSSGSGIYALNVGALASGTGLTWAEVELDFGSFPVWEKSFTINNPLITTLSKIAVYSSAKTATGRAGNDSEWDALVLTASPSPGALTITALALPGPVVGKRIVQYQIG